MNGVLNGKGKLGEWVITNANSGRSQLSFVSPDGIDHNTIRVLFNASNPQQKFLAYVRDARSDMIIALFAWDYDETGNPVRCLRIERLPDDTLKAWAQYVIHVEKTTNIVWSTFNVDVALFKTIFDQRGKYPMQTENGKVVWDGSKDKPGKLQGKTSQPNWLDKTTLMRSIIFTLILLPPLAMLFMAKQKRTSNNQK
jgi:hypothetical protein